MESSQTSERDLRHQTARAALRGHILDPAKPFSDPIRPIAYCGARFTRDCVSPAANRKSHYAPLQPRGSPCPADHSLVEVQPRALLQRILLRSRIELIEGIYLTKYASRFQHRRSLAAPLNSSPRDCVHYGRSNEPRGERLLPYHARQLWRDGEDGLLPD